MRCVNLCNISGSCAFDNKSKIRIDRKSRRSCTAEPHLFLNNKCEIHIILGFGFYKVDKHIAAETVIKCLCNNSSSVNLKIALKINTVTVAYIFKRIFPAFGADINVHITHFRNSGFFITVCKMNRFHTDYTVKTISANTYTLARKNPSVNSADLVKFKITVGCYIRYHKTYFVHMCRHHKLAFCRLFSLFKHNKVAEIICFNIIGTVFNLVNYKIANINLITRNTVAKAKLFKQFYVNH